MAPNTPKPASAAARTGSGGSSNCGEAFDSPINNRPAPILQAPRGAVRRPVLNRIVFTTSRLAEFCSERELINQTGHDSEDWPLVVLKELADNSLDAAEEAGVAPVITIDVTDAEIAVFDNGPGIAPETVAGILDYNTRTSSREAYCSPTRGAQGNALKTLLAMPFALDGERGETTIESHGVAHRITFSIDSIRQEPRIDRVCEHSLVKSGTRIAVSWPVSASSILDDTQANFLRIAEDYAWVNPHLSLIVKWDRAGCDPVQWAFPATDTTWRKWRPSDPTSPHWYDEPRLGRLIANNIAYAQDHGMPCRTICDFVHEISWPQRNHQGESHLRGGRRGADVARSILWRW
jgi:hypothetical protein